MKKAELLESLNRKLETLNKEIEFAIQHPYLLDDKGKQQLIMNSEKATMLYNIIIDVARIHSLD